VVSGCGRTISAHSLGKEIVCAIVRGITHGLCRSSFQGSTFSKIWAAKRLDAWSCLSLGSCLEARSREPPIGILTGFHSRQNRRYRLVHGNWPSRFFRHKSQAPWRPSKREREGKGREKKADPLIASVHFHLLKFPTAAVTGKDLFVLTYTISLAPL
jgi:hypothetical protein